MRCREIALVRKHFVRGAEERCEELAERIDGTDRRVDLAGYVFRHVVRVQNAESLAIERLRRVVPAPQGSRPVVASTLTSG